MKLQTSSVLRSFLSLAAVSVLAASGRAQFLSATISPNPAPVGTPVTLTVTNGTGQSINLPSSCTYSAVRAGAPTGTIIDAPLCLAVITPLAACASSAQPWFPPNGLAPGTYVFQVSYYDATFSGLRSSFFCFTYQAATDPTLSPLTPATRGQDWVLSIAAPGFPGAAYVAAASFTTDAGFQVLPTLRSCLDLDALFALSFPTPNPVLFANFQGVLNAGGAASGLAVHIPNLPLLQCLPLHVQAVLAPAGGATPVLTNVAGASIL